jgi:DNA gyrase subunit A
MVGETEKARMAAERLHLLLGLAAAMENRAAVMAAIGDACDTGDSRAALRELELKLPDDARLGGKAAAVLRLDEAQARMVLEVRLVRFTRRERDRVLAEIADLDVAPRPSPEGP